MTLIVLGLNHRTAPIELLDRVAVPSDLLPKALAGVTARPHVDEAVVLSTCNRVEVYANVSRFHPGGAELRDHLAEWAGVAPEDLAGHTYDYFDDGAAAHLFAVASGLDSMIVGERQIHLQVRDAFTAAAEEGAARTLLHRVFRQAIRVGRRVRAETGLSQGASSIVDLGLDTAWQALAVADPAVLVIGAGKIGGMSARRIADRARSVLVANRSHDKAVLLAERIGGEVTPLDALPAALRDADLVVTTTDARRPLVTAEDVRDAMAARGGRPQVYLDLAVPRDVDPACATLPGVTLLDVAALRGAVQTGPTGDAVAAARTIIGEEAAAYLAWTRGRTAGPVIAGLRRRAEDVRRAELARLGHRLGDLDPKQRQAIDALTRGIVNTLLHEPTQRLKQVVDEPDGQRYLAALEHLFDLGGPADGR